MFVKRMIRTTNQEGKRKQNKAKRNKIIIEHEDKPQNESKNESQTVPETRGVIGAKSETVSDGVGKKDQKTRMNT